MAVLIQRISALVLLALVSASFRATAPQGSATRSSPTTQIVLLGNGDARLGSRYVRASDCYRRQRHALPDRLRARSGAARGSCVPKGR